MPIFNQTEQTVTEQQAMEYIKQGDLHSALLCCGYGC